MIMDLWDVEYISSQLKRLQVLNRRAGIVERYSNELKSNLVELDGYHGQRLSGMPGTPGRNQTSDVEKLITQKEKARDRLQKATTKYLIIRQQVYDIIWYRLNYVLDLRQWELLRDVYIEELPEESLEWLHGKHWREKLRKLFRNYGDSNCHQKIKRKEVD
jgi:hypothetical protein